MIVKDPSTVDIRAVFCFPDVYEIGMSHLGMQILTHMFNQRDDVYCERVFSPWPDLHRIMKEQNIPLFSLETQDPIRDFEWLLITIQYEMCYPNILQILDLSQIPLKSGDRTNADPIVIGGGPCTCNPEPIADFFDLIYIGEGETVYDELLDLYKAHRGSGQFQRAAFLREASHIPGIYVPSLYGVSYREDGRIASFEPEYEDVPRNVINKGLTEEDILHGAGLAFDGGWQKVKLYFMLGQPTETEEDMRAIGELAEKIAGRYYEVPKEKRNGKCQINVSTSFFVPKPFTPFQWSPMCTKEDFLGRARIVNETIKSQTNCRSIRYSWHEADVTIIEGILARGDRRIADALIRVYEKGGIFSAWSDFFDDAIWQEAFAETGVDVDFHTTRERTEDEIFPWDFIDAGVTKGFLWKEWQRALAGEVTPNCRQQCAGCGALKYGGGVCRELRAGTNEVVVEKRLRDDRKNS